MLEQLVSYDTSTKIIITKINESKISSYQYERSFAKNLSLYQEIDVSSLFKLFLGIIILQLIQKKYLQFNTMVQSILSGVSLTNMTVEDVLFDVDKNYPIMIKLIQNYNHDITHLLSTNIFKKNDLLILKFHL